jgi:hypothetical protein
MSVYSPASSNFHKNLDYAKSLLLKLEQLNKPSPNSRSTSTSTQAPNTTRHRLVLKTFEERLDEIETADASTAAANTADSSDNDSDNDDVQELLRRFAPARPSTGIESEEQPLQSQATASSAAGGSDAQTHAAAATLTSSLRSRRPNAITQPSTSAPTATSISSSTPFAPRPQMSPSTNESLLSTHTLTQEDITSSLLSLAQALNKSTLAFSSALDESNDIVDGVAKGLDKNIEKMGVAGRAMLSLKGQARGSGVVGKMWAVWESIGLWVKVGVAWVVLLVVMFLFPKLRL